MALNITQIATLLFKKWLGLGQTTPGREFFQEPYQGPVSVLPTQIWGDSSLIPPVISGLSGSGQILGVVQYFINEPLTAVAGTSSSFYSANLIDAIPFNYGPSGSYNYALKDSTNASIAFGTGDWILDTNAGLVTFYTSVPANMPPVVTFYKYVGTKGLPSSSYAQYATSASHALIAVSASAADSITFIPISASYGLSASYSLVAESASWAPSQTSASYALTASYAANVTAGSSVSSSWASESVSSSYALTASYALNSTAGSSVSASWASESVSSSYAVTASYALNGVGTSESSSWASHSISSSYASLAQNVLGLIESASYALTSSYAVTSSILYTYVTESIISVISASYALTASYALNGGGGGMADSASWASSSISASYAITSSYAASGPLPTGFITFYEMDGNGDLMPSDNIVMGSYFEWDVNGDLEPML